MTRYPGAIWRPLDRNYTARKRSRTDCVILHIAVSEAASLYGWFNNPEAGSSSHLYVRRDGVTEQYMDMDHISWANGDGNGRSITVETQGMGSGTWSSAQVAKLAEICRWANAQYGVPLELMPDSKPSSRGIGHHRLGCDPYRVPGGERWSKAYGKICPGPDRIPQIPTIIAAAKGGIQHASVTTSKEDTLSAEEVKQINDHTTAEVDRLLAGLQWAPMGYDGAHLKKVLHEARTGAQASYSRIVGVSAAQAGVVEAVAKAAQAGQGLTPEQVQQIATEVSAATGERVEQALRDGITESYDLEVSATVKSKEA